MGLFYSLRYSPKKPEWQMNNGKARTCDIRHHRGQPGFLPGSPGGKRTRRDVSRARKGRLRRGCGRRGRDQVRRDRPRAPKRRVAPTYSGRIATAIDGIIVTLPNFGEERAIADTLRLADLNVPVLIQATPDTPGRMTIADRRDSFCGKMSACNNLKQYGIPYSLTTLHTEAPDSAEFAQDLDWFAAVCRVVRGLRRLRIGAIGARPAAFNTVRYSEKLLEANGHLHRDHRPLRDPRPHRSA